MLLLRAHLRLGLLLFLLFAINTLDGISQTVIWYEDFDDGGGGRWTLENAPGSKTNPTPAGITGLTYGTNAAVAHDNFIINDRNTPELDGDLVIGQPFWDQGQFVQGHHYDCSAPSNLPNPFINAAQPGPNQSLHITAYSGCATLLYGGTPQSDDWNCISDPDNGDVQTQTEQIAYLNQNIDATGYCNMVFTADFFLGGDTEGIKSHGTLLYSVDGGSTWEVLQDSLSSCFHFFAGTCNSWFRRSFALPANANNQNDLRVAVRWYDDGDVDNTGDYALGASFNIDNIMISACTVPNADFSISQNTACKGEVIYLNDLSTTDAGIYLNCSSILAEQCPITNWTWDIQKPGPPGGFNYVNGTSATSQNPQVAFTSNGTYNVTLTATNCAGDGVEIKSALIVVANCPPVANFITSLVTACTDPASSLDTVSFTDLSTTPSAAITSWSWSFSPATVTYVNGTTSSSQNIDVTFNAPGTYQVQLTVSSSEGNDTEIKTAYIQAIDCNCGGGGGGGPVTLFYEDFENSCASGCSANGMDTGNGPWTITDSSPAFDGCGFATAPNTWYVSCAENGNAAGSCGTGCGNDESLHVGSTTLGDLGAAYDTGGWCDLGLGGLGSGTETDVRTESPTIDCSGATGMTISFVYMENGDGAEDDASLWYYEGSTWSMLDPLAKTGTGCAPQGTWTAFSLALPASADNNPNVKVGFRWINNDNASGSDPSFAVDDITIIGTSGGGGGAKTWEGDVSSDWHTGGNWSDGLVPTSADDVLVPATICGACVMPQIDAPAFANNVCNYGIITINTDNTLTIDSDLLNEGAVTTTTVNPPPDILFANSPSVYKGGGTLYDVDVSTTSSDLLLETNMAPRSFAVATTGTVDLDVFTLSVNRNLAKTAGTFTAVNGTINFVDACGGCLDQTNTSDVSLNANQTFGTINVIKTDGIKTTFVSAFNYTVNTPKTVTIQSGILDAETQTFNGTGNVTMNGGELHLAKCATILPELTGTYTLPAGKIRFDGVCAQSVKSTATLGTDYFKVEFNGTGIKSLTGNTNIGDSLIFNLPTSLGNYVNAGTDTLFVLNDDPNIVAHTGGHVVGDYNRAILASGGDYTFHVGIDNSDTETYFEPITLTPNSLNGVGSVTSRFLDATPDPAVVAPIIYFGYPPNEDSIKNLETEGYWRMNPYVPMTSGTYQAMVSPDATYWSFDRPWAMGYHYLLKQETEGDSWDFSSGGVPVNDSTTQSFADFSNYVLAYADVGPILLAVELVYFKAICDGEDVYLNWASASEHNSHSYIIEKSEDGIAYTEIYQMPSAGNSTSMQSYSFVDRDGKQAYYRLLEKDMNGVVTNNGVLYVQCNGQSSGLEASVYPNPGNGPVNLSIVSPSREIATIRMVDLTGKVITTEQEIVLDKGVSVFKFNEQLNPGIYMFVIESSKGILTERFTITH